MLGSMLSVSEDPTTTNYNGTKTILPDRNRTMMLENMYSLI